jgi:hypothetical protein
MWGEEISALAEAWLACRRLPMSSPEREQFQWVMDSEYDFLEENPEKLWLLILAINHKDQSPAVQEVLSAGPLENLLSRYGLQFIDRVETQAPVDPGFAQLLCGVSESGIGPEVWLRVKSVWDRRGWDGIR